MDVIQDGKNTATMIEEKLEERIRSEDKFNRKMLNQNNLIIFLTFAILLLTLLLVYHTIMPK